MPNPFAAAALSAMIAATPAPELLQRCATALSPQQQDTLLTPPRKQKDPHRRFMTIDVSCPLGQADGKMDIIKKNAAGDIIVASFTYKAGRGDRIRGGLGRPESRVQTTGRPQAESNFQSRADRECGQARPARWKRKPSFLKRACARSTRSRPRCATAKHRCGPKRCGKSTPTAPSSIAPRKKHERLKSHFDKR